MSKYKGKTTLTMQEQLKEISNKISPNTDKESNNTLLNTGKIRKELTEMFKGTNATITIPFTSVSECEEYLVGKNWVISIDEEEETVNIYDDKNKLQFDGYTEDYNYLIEQACNYIQHNKL